VSKPEERTQMSHSQPGIQLVQEVAGSDGNPELTQHMHCSTAFPPLQWLHPSVFLSKTFQDLFKKRH
jgi:hypothetical protein